MRRIQLARVLKLGTAGLLAVLVLAQITATLDQPDSTGYTASAAPAAAANAAALPAATSLVSWSESTPVPASQYDNADIVPGMLRADGYIWEIYGDGTTWHRLRGTSIDSLVELPPAAYGTPTQPFAHALPGCADDHYWPEGLWSDGTTWYTTVHVEYGYFDLSPGGASTCLPVDAPYAAGHHFRLIGLATSTNFGASWSWAGDIITSADSSNVLSYAGTYFDWGDGDQRLLVDPRSGYFYLYYKTGWVNKTDASAYDLYQTIRVARSPISARMAPGTWQKWYDGAWSQPGLGGLDSDVFRGEDSAAVFYSAYLGQYVAFGNYPSFIATATDLTTQNWTASRLFTTPTSPAQLEWYNWVVDPLTGDQMTVSGRTLRVYSADDYDASHYACAVCPPAHYTLVTLNSGMAPIGELPVPAYPPESVPSQLPEWQWDVDIAYNPQFDNGSLWPWQVVGQGTARVQTTVTDGAKYAAALSGQGACLIQTLWNVSPGRPYTFAAWVATSGGDGATMRVSNTTAPHDFPTNALTYAADPRIMADTSQVREGAPTPFVHLSIQFTPGPYDTAVTIAICSSAHLGRVYVDDAEVSVGYDAVTPMHVGMVGTIDQAIDPFKLAPFHG